MLYHVISCVIGLFRQAFNKVGEKGQICFPRLLATTLLSGKGKNMYVAMDMEQSCSGRRWQAAGGKIYAMKYFFLL
jgi:hypothetical protein